MALRIPELAFSTDDAAPRDAITYWTACIPEYEVRQLPGQHPEAFQATTQAWLLADLILAHGAVSSGTFTRSTERLRADGVDACNLTLLTQGSWSATFAGRPEIVGQGQFAALDCSQPSNAEVSEANRYINLSVSRAALLSAVPRLPDFNGRVLNSAAGYLLADHLMALCRYLPGLSADQIPLVRQATLLLIGAAFKDLPQHQLDDPTAELRQRVRRYVERQLNEPELSPERICRDLAIGRTALYRAFATQGGVRAHIQRRRLEVVRAMLLLPNETRPIAELARSFGFGSASHFTQAFRGAFGQTPSDLRSDCGLIHLPSLDPADAGIAPVRYARWMHQLVAR